MRVLGIDPSWTATGFALIEDGHLRRWWVVTTAPPTHDMDRIKRIVSELGHVANACHPIDLLAIEGYAGGDQTNRERMGELGGVLRYAIHHNLELPYEVWPVARWRKAVLGARAPREKAQVGMALAQRFKDWAVTDLNALEAAAVAYTSWLRHQPAEIWTAYQVEAFAEPKKKLRRRAA